MSLRVFFDGSQQRADEFDLDDFNRSASPIDERRVNIYTSLKILRQPLGALGVPLRVAADMCSHVAAASRATAQCRQVNLRALV
jgi:hypothetical protein